MQKVTAINLKEGDRIVLPKQKTPKTIKEVKTLSMHLPINARGKVLVTFDTGIQSILKQTQSVGLVTV